MSYDDAVSMVAKNQNYFDEGMSFIWTLPLFFTEVLP